MSIFRAYDIRGIAGKDLTEDVAKNIGKAFGTYVEGGDIVVGRDCRLSSPALRDSLIKGLMDSGCNVTDIGMVPTPVLYFAISHYGKDGGIMITGSHNAPEYNGFKLCKGDKTLYGEDIQKLKNMVESGAFVAGEGKVTEEDVVDDYLKFVKDRIHLGKRKIAVVIDSGNGTAGEISGKLFEELGCRVTKLNWRPDGNFPNHHPDPTVDEFLKELIRRVKIERADFGIAYDGDADRLGIVDDKGNIIRGDQILMLFARDVLKESHAKIIFEVKCSMALAEDIREKGGIPIMYRTGHSFIKKKMREEGALLAGEMSGHFFFADNYYGYDDGIFASARMAELLSNSKEKLSETIAKMPKYYSTPEIRVPCPEEEKFRIVEEITKKFQDKYEVITVDGARVQVRGGWGLVRASNTEPALILRFEAKTEEKLDEIKELILDELREFECVKDNLP
ncbi:MAG: phosphomannomutase/phosphoglucomutase [Candidatus Altiarchaeales archaeon]|nr:phosphomannomutase/phosphoglucomutase [Candidatus Altiarchaeota archaeon]MCG2783177.1 phosphomannomutase/phosphoglucomutase [Candidatus Altiarchaeales archaeon]MBU4265773.1 phosphomannomutase/phosphoglucomutase [Candidatus Altiarchaeota archaeon]MBU4341006.1 phosphomannomutase/phosphoglucomutase [Candidatus Altiarchaeota archaeon]MBU4405997.1 phosphomannomutase/phosphoglucomutase [Candidatus Altiarchaeota archaeon]